MVVAVTDDAVLVDRRSPRAWCRRSARARRTAFATLATLIGEQRHVQAVLRRPPLVGVNALRRDAHHRRLELRRTPPRCRGRSRTVSCRRGCCRPGRRATRRAPHGGPRAGSCRRCPPARSPVPARRLRMLGHERQDVRRAAVEQRTAAAPAAPPRPRTPSPPGARGRRSRRAAGTATNRRPRG